MDIKEILKDLYALDPGLKKHEKDLINIINKLIESRPDSKIDKNFVKKLKKELLSQTQNSPEEINVFWRNLNAIFMKKIVYAAASLAVIVLLATTALVFFTKDKTTINLNQKKKITELAKNAFGSLALDTTATNLGASGISSIAPSPEAMSSRNAIGLGGGGGLAATAQVAQVGQSEGAKIAGDSAIGMMPPYYYINYTYVYKGDDFSVPEKQMAVYKRIMDKQVAGEFAGLLQGVNYDLIDLNNFSDLNVSNFTVNEDREFGYSIYFNFDSNQVSLYPNYYKWPNVFANCADDTCYSENTLTKSDVPEETELFTIAKNFLSDYGISLDNYGEPQVMENYRVFTILRAENTDNYVPETIPVIFPLLIDGQAAYDQSGNPAGLMVEVNIRYGKVSSVNNINSTDYDKSDYAVETDKDKIIKLAENGGLYPVYQDPSASETVEIELGTPTMGLMQYYKYEPNSYTSDELYVPALIFPITQKSDEVYLYQNSIVVPLVEGFVNDYPVPMPLMEKATNGGGSSSAGSAGSEVTTMDATLPTTEENPLK